MKRLGVLGVTLGCALTLVSAALCYTPAGLSLLSGIFNLSGEALLSAQKALLFFLVTPVLFYVRFFTEGLFMREKRSAAIGITGAVRLILVFVSGWLMVRLMPDVEGAVLGMALMTVAAFSDALFTSLAFYSGHRGAVTGRTDRMTRRE